MQKSLSEKIIDKWFQKLTDSGVDKTTVDLLKKTAEINALSDVKALKDVISKIEENNAKNQNSGS